MRQRQYSEKPPYRLSHALRRSLRYSTQLLQSSPPRVLMLGVSRRSPLIVASDGRVDDSTPPSISILLWDCETDERFALFAVVPKRLVELWSEEGTDHCIAQVELAAIVTGMLSLLSTFRSRDVVWFVDNTVALSAVVCGRCKSDRSDAAVSILNFAMASACVRVWFEYIQSHSN